MAAKERPELIEDREIASLTDDRLGHEQIASELAKLAQSVPMPSNIALYGAWGSGKTGIGNMLSAKLKPIKGVRFARFDAFKYAENPLRRNFVSVVATSLKIDEPKYHADLYRGRTSTDFSVPVGKIGQLLGIFALVVLVCVVAVSVGVSIVAAFQGESPLEALAALGVSTLPASLVPASLLTAVIALVGKTFVVERRLEKADSDEEFERLLQELVDQSGAQRVVIFVDELDRCSASDVVETLNAVRTFLGVKKCVFVVAADQQVLEQALTTSSEQATPVDSVNPYYSAGSAYLDKVFQYQLSVPPLMPQSVTSFAVGLVANRGGVWSRVDAGLVCSILVPAHVRSPRRVKNLLNAFVIANRLAEARYASGELNLKVAAHVDELARLICLRVEFPLFARDLVSDPRLSEYVLALADAGRGHDKEVWTTFPFVDPRTREIAEGYAARDRYVDRLLVSDEEDESDNDVEEVQKAQGQQLLDYLSRTRTVKGPTKALIFLQNIGSVYGLSATVAEQLERDAQNAAIPNLKQTFEGLNADEKLAAVDLLVQQARAAVGLEVPNIVTSVLSILSDESLDLSDRADSTGVIVTDTLTTHPELISSATALGAWRLALAGSRYEAESLGKLVLESPLLESSPDLFAAVLRSAPEALEMNHDRFVSVFTERLFDAPDATASEIETAQTEVVRPLLEAASPLISSRLSAAIDAKAAADAATSTAAAAAVSSSRIARSTMPVEDDPVEIYDPAGLIRQLGRLISTLDRDCAETLGQAMLRVNRHVTRDVMQPLLPKIAPVTKPEMARQILSNGSLGVLNVWPQWFDDVPSSVLFGGELPQADFENAMERLWSEADGSSVETLKEVRMAATSLRGLLDSAPPEFVEGVQAMAEVAGPPLMSETDIEEQQHHIAIAEQFASADLARHQQLIAAEAVSLTATMSEGLGEEAIESPLVEWILKQIRKVFSYRDSTGARLDADIQRELIGALAATQMLTEFDAARAAAIVCAETSVTGAEQLITKPDIPQLESFEADLSASAFNELVSDWLRTTSEPFANVLSFMSDRLSKTTSQDVIDSFTSWQAGLTAEERVLLARHFVGSARSAVPPVKVLRAIGFYDVGGADLASLLIERYGAETSNPERQNVLELWALAGISDDAARRRLLREVLIPFFGLNAQASRTGLAYLDRLAAPVPSTIRKPLADAVVAATKGHAGLEDRGRTALQQLGYKVNSRGLFGLRKEVDTSS